MTLPFVLEVSRGWLKLGHHTGLEAGEWAPCSMSTESLDCSWAGPAAAGGEVLETRQQVMGRKRPAFLRSSWLTPLSGLGRILLSGCKTNKSGLGRRHLHPVYPFPPTVAMWPLCMTHSGAFSWHCGCLVLGSLSRTSISLLRLLDFASDCLWAEVPWSTDIL